MLAFNNSTAEKKIINLVKNNHKKIKVKPGKLRYNYKCHLNAVHEAIKKKDKKVAMCVCVENGFVSIHFVNYHNKKFIDNTLGVWITQSDTYFIRWVKEDEFYNINNIFGEYRKYLNNQLGWWLKLTSNVDF